MFARQHLLTVTIIACLCSLPSWRTFAWGNNGHQFITEKAIPILPYPLRTFFSNHTARIKTLAATEPPGTHYIDIDYYPEFFLHTFPRDQADLVAIYGTAIVNQYGTGPWTAVSHYESLRSLFTNAQTATDWTNLLTTAGMLAHYIEDLHNPMHLATNYNGQYTGQTGLHSRYETTMVNLRISAGLQLSVSQADCVYYTSIRDAIFDDIDLVYPFNATILAADLSAAASTNYYQRLWDDGCSSFTPSVMEKGAIMVASAWYSAWRDAGFPQPHGVPRSTNLNLKLQPVFPSQLALTLLGDAGQVCELQSSSNLINWQNLATVTNLNGRFTYNIPAASGAASFFRARIPIP